MKFRIVGNGHFSRSDSAIRYSQLFNLSHVNTALTQHNAEEVHGIIGADILQKGKAVIDYNKNVLYLKKIKKQD